MRQFTAFRLQHVRRVTAACMIALFGGAASPQPASSQTTIPPGTSMTFRLLDSVASDDPVGRSLRVMTVTPITVDGALMLAPGAFGRAHVAQADGTHEQRHAMRIAFDSLDARGTLLPVTARVTAVDNARETVDSAGLIVGPPIGRSLHEKRTWALMALGVVHPIAAAAFLGIGQLGRHEADRAIRYPPGTDLVTVLTVPVTMPHGAPPRTLLQVLSPDSLRVLTRRWPIQAEAEHGKIGADLLNIAMLGDSSAVVVAMHAAGWTTAAPLSTRTDFVTLARAFERRGYSQQPVSTLVVNGRPPAMVFERVTNTFAKRHHVRIWRAEGAVRGKAVWLGSASHDVAIAFLADRRHFTHRIDPQLDDARDKLANDLWAATCIVRRSVMSRTLPAGLRVNDGRDTVRTDGALVVLQLDPRLCGNRGKLS